MDGIGLGQTLLVNAAAIAAATVALWLASVACKDASIVDPAWGAGFAAVAWISWFANSPHSPRDLLLACLATVWGMRLSLYLAWRNRGTGEDRRYAAMRARHGDRFWLRSLRSVFLLQGAILWIISLPLQALPANDAQRPLGWLDGGGVLLWTCGFVFETVGDWQLASFRAQPQSAGQVLDQGLWRYTRHPNYFGDFCIWWGLYLLAAAGGASWTAVSPLLMSFLLLKVSGVALLESDLGERRPDYAAYQARTNAFFPGPRRSSPNRH